jgi:predicted Zn-dependent protease
VPTPLSSRWNGHYFDGKTAARHPAVITVTREGLHFRLDDGTSRWWPFAEIRQTQGFMPGEHARFERLGRDPEAIVVTDARFLDAVREIAPHVRGQVRAPASYATRILLAALAAAGAAALAGLLYLYGIPGLADIAASRVPVAWEERLGLQVVDAVVPRHDRCRDAEQQHALEHIAAVLLAPASGTPYTMRVTVADNRDVNAVAAPGGFIVIFRGLLEETARPEELAGVMAHEIQHVLHRHGTRAVFREMSLGLLLRIATGGSGPSSLDVARAVGGLRYRRGDEEAADRDGMAMVQRARIDPQGMVAMYERLQRRAERRGEPPTYLSSHPRTAERLASLKRQAAEARYAPVALLPDQRWSHIRGRCE